MKIIFFIFIITFSSFSLAETKGNWIFDSVPLVQKTQFRSTLGYLKERDVKLSVRSIFNKYNIDTAIGDNVYNLVFKNVKMLFGESKDLRICSISKHRQIPTCSKDINSGFKIKKPSIIYAPHSYLAVWDIARDMRINGITSGGVVLSNGGYVKIDDNNSKAFIYLSRSVEVDGEPLAIKLSSEMFGYAISIELKKRGISNFTNCSNGYSSYICQEGRLGYFEVVGDLLLDMSSTCITCTEEEKLKIKYWSFLNLFRYLGPKEKMNGIYRSYLFSRDEIKNLGLDITFLEKRYINHLSS